MRLGLLGNFLTIKDMFVRRVKRDNNIISVRIVENQRVGKKTIQKNIKIIGQSKKAEEIAILEEAAKSIILSLQKNNPLLQPKKDSHYKEVPDNVQLKHVRKYKKVNCGIFNVFGHVYDEMKLNKLIKSTYKDKQWNDIFKALVLGRIAGPESKLKTARVLARDYLVNYPLEKFYRTMDRALKFKDKAQDIVLEKTKKLHEGSLNVMLFDVTTLYFESVSQDDLKDFGFSKDNKFKEVQIVLSLITTDKGYPVGYKLFPGNTSEGKTLIAHLTDVQKRFDLKKVILIADRGMFSEANLKDMEDKGIEYIVACKLRVLSKSKKEEFLTDNDFIASVVEKDLYWIKDYEHNKRRLIVSYSSSRASKDKKMRERLVERILKKAKDGKVKAGDLIGNNGSKKFIKVQGKKLEVDQNKITEEARWDGLHGVITNNTRLISSTILSRYRQLWKIEEAFRFNKHDLKMRPIYHWKPDRIKSHILICYLAFAVSRFTMEKINRGRQERLDERPLSFARCIEELSRMESHIVKNAGDSSDKNLYVLPAILEPAQQDIFTALEIEHRSHPFVL